MDRVLKAICRWQPATAAATLVCAGVLSGVAARLPELVESDA